MRALVTFLGAATTLLATAVPASAAPVPAQLIAETDTVLCTDHTDSGGKASCDAVVTGTADYGTATAHNSVRIVQR